MTPPGAKWITVHPNGPDEDGRPVLIKDDGSGTILGGMGGRFNGHTLGALYDKRTSPTSAPSPEHPKAAPEPEPEPEPTSNEAHPKYNEHLPDYEDLGPELQAHVYGTPEHGGEGQGWRFHLRNPHLEAMARQGEGALPGGLLLPHKEGGVVYHQHAGDADDYESGVHSMAVDVSGQIHEHLGREHERRMRDEEHKQYQEETERELAAWRRDQQAGVRKAIATFGGIARFKDTDAKGRRYMDSEYNDTVPKWARNQSGLTPDRARHALNEQFPHLGLETPSDLFDYLDQFEDERVAFRAGQAQRSRARAGAAAERKATRERKKEATMAGAREADDDVNQSHDAGSERPVRESTVQPESVRANIVREGRGYRIKDCQIMAAGAGNAMMQNVYEPEAIEALVPEVKRQSKAFLDHSLPAEVRERGHRSLRDLAGVYDKRTVRYDPQTQACLADLIVRPTVYDEYVAPVLEAGDNLGISVDGIGHCPDQPRRVKGWKRFNSADLVPAGGARGFIVREAATAAEKQAERSFAMALLDDVTATDVRESAPTLFEQIGQQYAAAHALVREADAGTRPSGPPPSDARGERREAGVDDTRLSTLEAQVREAQQRAEAADARVYELEAETNRRAVADFVGAMVRECGLVEDKQAAFVAKRFSGATMGPEGTYTSQEALETAVREAAEEFKAVLPQVPSGQIVGLGSGQSGKFQAPKTNDSAIVTAMDRLFGAPSVSFPASNGSATPGSG